MQYRYEYFNTRELGLAPDVWHRFASALPPRVYEKDRMIYWQGETAERFYYLTEGRVKTFISSGEGEEKILTVYQAGHIFGEASFFDGMPRVSSARALTRSRIVSISREVVAEQFAQDPSLALSMLRYLARTVRMLSAQVDNMTFLQADRRIARLLVNLQERDEDIFCTHEELGSSAGVSRVTVSRVLGEFERLGWIDTGYRKIRILKREELRHFAGI
ncbi:Crp/Fnr family transcriptional regulator [Papillibacter cinnamivorans]|uniref:CRP/FNR family transcriptional regulator, anaerobic regulatory protein n=1 Tax=Papillibacter cinnamivorans DSM 12816 TaxID=1122930 RepID=A0A1W1ZNG8_9FIRM|nr:Crp/Fnr family transcriptional regulator [Papillibacter cinnamivorans]SMC50110.1 CRP/FNR family transcriptional regulator, anaerobic regulatory protein [Papillibacter cinnamivorans DSM 12816]